MMLSAAAAALTARTASILAQGPSASKALNALFDQFMKENLDQSPIQVTSLGLDHGERAHQKSELDDLSEAAIARSKALTARQLSRLQAFDRKSLSAADAISYDVVTYGLRADADANSKFSYGSGSAGLPYVVSQFNGSYQDIPSFLDSAHSIETKADCDAYLARLGAFAQVLDQEVEVARHDQNLGVVPPSFTLVTTLKQLQSLRSPAPEESPLANSLARRAQAQRLAGDYRQQASQIVRDQVYPALERQIAFYREQQKIATSDAGVWKLPRGAEYYAAALVAWATTSRDPADLHQQGLQLVADLNMQCDKLMRTQGMTQGTVGSRLRAMFKDTQYLYPNTDTGRAALLTDLNRRVQSVWNKLPTYFGVLPKTKVEIRRAPKEKEAGAASGYYESGSLDGKRPGIYWINLRDTSEQPKWLLPTLTYHESIPGHHLQRSIQREAELPLIRKVAGFSGYTEGWALYAEQLAVEMGEYDADAIGQIGQLHDALLRAVRVVVDTGLHSRKWPREQAVRYFTDNLGDPQSAATTEVDRYCVMPGQACAYELGKLKFLEVRERARTALGAKYDIRKFHDAVLLPGAVPLDLLDGLYR